MTSTSDGPAGRSMAAPAGSAATICLAAVTHALPGPKILSTLRTDSVPKASAAIACAPPILYTVSTPQSSAATSTAACSLPSGPGELAMARALQPAIRAGTASMMAVDGSGAEPAGT